MKIFRDIYLMFKRKLMETLRNPVFLVMMLLTPIMYLALFSPLLKKLTGVPGFTSGSVLDVFVPGLLVIIAFMGGLFAGYNMIDELRNGVVERFRVTPTSRFALLAGRVLRDTLNVLVTVTFFSLISMPFGFHVHIWGFLILLLLVALVIIATSSLGNALGLILQDEERLSPIVQGLNLPILLLSGVLLPMTLAPKWLQTVADFNPLFYVVQASRLLAAGNIWNAQTGYAFLYMVPLTVIVLIWATNAFRRAIA